MKKRKNILFSKSSYISIIGILLFSLIAVEFFISLNQPVSNLGITIDFNEKDFFVSKVVKDTPAYKAGIKSKSSYNSLNDYTLDDIIKYRSSVSEETYKKEFSTFYNFGQTIKLKDSENNVYSFTLSKLPLADRIKTTDAFTKIKFLIAFIMVLTAISIALFLPSDSSVTPLVYSLYFIAVASANIFESEFASPVYSNVTAIFLDFGLFFTFSSMFFYFSNIFEYANHKNLFRILKYIPAFIFVIKYIHVAIFKWDIIVNPFYKLNSLIVVICFLIILVLFIYVTFVFPKNLTVTFKFFLIGIAFAIVPMLIDHFGYILSNSLFMVQNEKIFSIVPFLCVPFMLLLAILHNKNMIRSRYVSWITTYFAFAIVSASVFITITDYIPIVDFKLFSLLYVLITPAAFRFSNQIIMRFFSLNTDINSKKLEEFKNLISPITETYNLHVVTSEEIKKLLNCSFIFFYKKNSKGTWDNLYTMGNIDEESKIRKLNESYTKKRVAFYNDGSFSVPILRNNKTTGVIYIGPRENNEQYLPGEHILIEQIIRIFHNHYLMYTNNQLLNELKEKNDKVVKMQEGTILSMANLIESRDGGTGAHVKRTAEYSVLISRKAMELGLFKNEINEAFIDLLYKSAPMHDIGKIIVSDSVLKKPGKLTSEEFEQMKLHTTEGEHIVKEVLSTSGDEDYIKMTSEIAMHHHEKWDGTGYPAGLYEEEIPLSARILAIADVFDALVSPRCYKEPIAPKRAFEIIKEDAGKHFDPVLADVFLQLKDEAIEIMKHEYL